MKPSGYFKAILLLPTFTIGVPNQSTYDLSIVNDLLLIVCFYGAYAVHPLLSAS